MTYSFVLYNGHYCLYMEHDKTLIHTQSLKDILFIFFYWFLLL